MLAATGRDLGASRWLTIDLARIDQFAEVTGDHVWLHVDPARAASGPFGRTIAHGFLTLSLLNMFLQEMFMPENVDWGENYGVNRVRFPAPVPVGSQLRCHARLISVRQTAPRVVQTTVQMSVEAGQDKSGCVAEMLQYYAFLLD
ncbi:MaoC family dehydratase [Paracoccaceae bacterium]